MRSPFSGSVVRRRGRRSARLLLVVLDQAQHVLPDEPPYGPRAVLRDRDRAVGPNDEPRRLHYTALLLVEGPERGCRVLEGQSVADGHTEPELSHRLSGFIL